MSLKPFSSSPSPRTPSGDSGGDRKLSGRKYTLTLSFSGLITSGIIMIIAVGWIFAFGVIVGRGYNPEKKLPELARLLPPPEGAEAPVKQDILKPEELTFMKDLKQPASAASAVRGEPPKPTTPTASKPETTPPKQPPVAEKKFHFVLQAAAYKTKEQAERLRVRLEGEGVRSRLTIEKDSKGKPKWVRVQVLVRGTEADAEAAKQTLVRMGVKDASMVSKKPVGKTR